MVERITRRFRDVRLPSPAVGFLTVAAWCLAVYSWVGLYRLTDRGSGLGWDLLTPWRAERIFAHGGAPYAVKSFVYPPSCLLLLRPLGSLTRHQLTVGGLVATLVIAWVSVMLSAHALGKRWWGITAALTIWLLHFTEAMRGELSLENVTVLAFLGLALCYVFALRGHWIAAAAAIGLSLSVKPLLLVVLLVFLLARQWKAFAVAVAIPAFLNLVAFAIVANPSGVWSKLPSILNRSGYGVNFNSAWVDVARVLGLPEGVSILLRLVTVALVVLGALLAWSGLRDTRLQLVTTTSLLLIGSFLSGTLSEYHFMLTLVPLAMTVMLRGSPMRTVTGVIGTLWIMGLLVLPDSVLGTNKTATHSAFRAFGMTLVLLTVIAVLLKRRRDTPAALGSGAPDVAERRPETAASEPVSA
jgi:arabinofuranan 3-O-arabinosyltransferase